MKSILEFSRARREQHAIVMIAAYDAMMARTLARACDQVPRKRPRITYVSSSAARALFDADRIMADLAANMARPVLWADTLRHAWERGARTALEMPSGSVLTRLALEADFGAGLALCADGNRLDTLVQVVRENQ